MCGCTDRTHQEVRDAIRDQELLSIPAVHAFLEWRTPDGCATCRPALNYYLISSWPHRAQDDPQSRFINERSHANIQKDGTYSVVPRMWGGETNSSELRRIADVVDKYAIPTVKVTGGQRVDLLGVKKEDLPGVWRDLGMPSGHAYAKALRTVKTCVGSEWCRFGTQDSTRMGQELERALWRMYAPHKVKLAVSGCPRNCAESGIKDVGVIGVDSGWEIHVAGNGGIKTEVAQFLCKVKTHEEVLEHAGAFLQLYREEGWYLERTVHFVGRVGLDYVKKRILEDARAGGSSGSACSSRSTASPIPGTSRRRPASTSGSSRRSDDQGLQARRDPQARRPPLPLQRRRAHRDLPQRLRPRVRAARRMPAQGRAAFAGHRVRRERRVPAAQLVHRPEDRHRRGAG
jgi:nitrite reductase (NADH) large subunit